MGIQSVISSVALVSMLLTAYFDPLNLNYLGTPHPEGVDSSVDVTGSPTSHSPATVPQDQPPFPETDRTTNHFPINSPEIQENLLEETTGKQEQPLIKPNHNELVQDLEPPILNVERIPNNEIPTMDESVPVETLQPRDSPTGNSEKNLFDPDLYFKTKQQKFVGQLLALLITIGAVFYSTRFVVLKKRPPVSFTHAFIPFALFVGLMYYGAMINFPGSFQPTHPQVALQHQNCRRGCSEALARGDFIESANLLMSSSLGKQMAEHSVYARNIISTNGILVANWMLTNMGTSLAVAPFLIWLFVAVLVRFKTGTLGSTFPLDIQGTVIPITVNITICCASIFAYFLFYVDAIKFSDCIWISGHWYTASTTMLLMSVVLVHLMQSLGLKSLVTLCYFVYCSVFVGAMVIVLRNTQEFYHDSFEAVAALKHAMIAACIVASLFYVIEIIARYKAKAELEQVSATEETIRKLDPKVKELLKKAGISAADLFSGETVHLILETVEATNPPQSKEELDLKIGAKTEVNPEAVIPSISQPSSVEKGIVPEKSDQTLEDVPPPPEISVDADIPPPPTEGIPDAPPDAPSSTSIRNIPVKKTWNLNPAKPKSNKPTARPNSISTVDLISNLQSALKNTALKPVQLRERKGTLPPSQEKTLAQILQEKMAQRRVFLEVEPTTAEATTTDGWE